MNTSCVNDSLPNNTVHTIKVIYIITSSMNFLLSVPTNSYILHQIIIETGKMSDFFTFNLALCEIIFCLKTPLLLLNLYAIPGTLDDIVKFFDGIFGMGRPLFQMCICLERYLAVIHPVLFLKYKPLRYRVASLVVVWLTVFGCCMIGVHIHSMMFYIFMPVYMILFSGKLLCCLVILRALRKPGPGEGKKEGDGVGLVKMKAFKVIAMVTVSTVLNYGPFLPLLALKSTLNRTQYVLALDICISVSILTGLIQPWLYLHRTGKLSCTKSP